MIDATSHVEPLGNVQLCSCHVVYIVVTNTILCVNGFLALTQWIALQTLLLNNNLTVKSLMMEEISLLLNASNTNVSSLGEFPYWQWTFALSLVTYTFSVMCIIVIHLFLLVALFKTKKEQFKPLNLLHTSLLVSAIVEDAF